MGDERTRLRLRNAALAKHELELAAIADEELELAILLSLQDTTTVDEDEALAWKLHEALSGLGGPGHGGVEARKQHEECLTAAVFGDLIPFPITASANADGTVTVGSGRYKKIECGASHDGHTNLCFYMSITKGLGASAVQLKKDIAPAATEFSNQIGANTDFAGPSTPADVEVVRAYVLLKKTRVVVYDARGSAATSYRTDDCVGECVYLYNDRGHYQRLVPA